MQAYLLTTGAIFGVIAVAHALRTVAEWPRLATDPWFTLEGPGLGVAAAALGGWAWSLLRRRAGYDSHETDAAGRS